MYGKSVHFTLIFYFIPENLIDNLKAEIKRLQRRKQLQYNSMELSDGGSSGGESSESPTRSDKPLFTFKQVIIIVNFYIY